MTDLIWSFPVVCVSTSGAFRRCLLGCDGRHRCGRRRSGAGNRAAQGPSIRRGRRGLLRRHADSAGCPPPIGHCHLGQIRPGCRPLIPHLDRLRVDPQRPTIHRAIRPRASAEAVLVKPRLPATNRKIFSVWGLAFLIGTGSLIASPCPLPGRGHLLGTHGPGMGQRRRTGGASWAPDAEPKRRR